MLFNQELEKNLLPVLRLYLLLYCKNYQNYTFPHEKYTINNEFAYAPALFLYDMWFVFASMTEFPYIALRPIHT